MKKDGRYANHNSQCADSNGIFPFLLSALNLKLIFVV